MRHALVGPHGRRSGRRHYPVGYVSIAPHSFATHLLMPARANDGCASLSRQIEPSWTFALNYDGGSRGGVWSSAEDWLSPAPPRD